MNNVAPSIHLAEMEIIFAGIVWYFSHQLKRGLLYCRHCLALYLPSWNGGHFCRTLSGTLNWNCQTLSGIFSIDPRFCSVEKVWLFLRFLEYTALLLCDTTCAAVCIGSGYFISSWESPPVIYSIIKIGESVIRKCLLLRAASALRTRGGHPLSHSCISRLLLRGTTVGSDSDAWEMARLTLRPCMLCFCLRKPIYVPLSFCFYHSTITAVIIWYNFTGCGVKASCRVSHCRETAISFSNFQTQAWYLHWLPVLTTSYSQFAACQGESNVVLMKMKRA